MNNDHENRNANHAIENRETANIPSREITSFKRNIKLELITWNALRNLKKPNETFNDVVLSLLRQRTVSVEGKSIKTLKYARKKLFIETSFNNKSVGIEFEYNDVKNEQASFSLDLCMNKVFYGRKIVNPSEFYGVDRQNKHYNPVYLNIYLKCVAHALRKEFILHTWMNMDTDFENIARWRQIYYDHSLSEDSFQNDIEDVLSSGEEKPDDKILLSIKNSPSNAIWHFIK